MRTVAVGLGHGRVADLPLHTAQVVTRARTKALDTRAMLQVYVALGGAATEELVEAWANVEATIAVLAKDVRPERGVERLGLLPAN